MSTIKFALIGCGRIAIRHIEALNAQPEARIVAVCDANLSLAQDKAQALNLPAFDNYHAMLQSHPEIDVVILLTPSGMHFEQSVEILKHYQKHLLIEKPMVMTLAQANVLKQLADECGRMIFPIYQNRFNKAVCRVKEAMRPQGELGAVRVGTVRVRWCRPQRYYDLSPWRGTWAMDGGAMTNQGIHYIDLLRYLCGEVKRVHAKLATLGADIEVEDTAVAILEFESGALGVIEIMTSARPHDYEASISCVCEEGLAVISGIATNVLQTFSPDPAQESLHSEVFPTVYGFGHNEVMRGVVDCLLHGAAPAIQFEDGLASMQLLHALYRSDEIGGWVNVKTAGDSQRLGKQDDQLLALYRTSA
jgi:UDP-N-acetyl-2-amino-2-deoxyglucuronate dehydrogenase